MRYLLDTNVLLRLVLVDEPEHKSVLRAVEKLRAGGNELCCTTQALRELWHVGTRSPEANGIGLSPNEILGLIAEVRRQCLLLPESAETFEDWLGLVSVGSIRGAACHDANHIAIAKSNQVDYILTFDLAHFRRFGTDGIKPLRPQDV